jgi:hypothetical protein
LPSSKPIQEIVSDPTPPAAVSNQPKKQKGEIAPANQAAAPVVGAPEGGNKQSKKEKVKKPQAPKQPEKGIALRTFRKNRL